jgi:hypothetical protein
MKSRSGLRLQHASPTLAYSVRFTKQSESKPNNPIVWEKIDLLDRVDRRSIDDVGFRGLQFNLQFSMMFLDRALSSRLFPVKMPMV